MEAHRSLYFQGSSESQLTTSSLPVYVSTSEENYPSLPNSQLLQVPRELNANPMAFYSSSPSDDGVVGHRFSSTPGLSNELFVPSVGPLENYSRNSPILSQLPNTGASLPVTTCHSMNNNSSRFTDPLAEIFGYSVNTPVKINEVGRNNINGEINLEDPQLKMPCQVMESCTNFSAPHRQLLQIPTSSWQSSCAINSMSSPSGASKQRMRWTLELHEAFVEAVTELEGRFGKATPKNIVDLLKIEGLTIDHVRSHLQKYRATTNARYRPESSEGSSEKRIAQIQEVSPSELRTGIDIAKALQFQLEVQKRLHEQLENQRNLQLQVEQYGEFLQKMMYENQCKVASTSSPVNLCTPQPRHVIPSSLDQSELGTSWVENEGRENDGVIDMTTSVRVSRWLGEKQKAPETEAYEDLEQMLQGQVPDPQSKRKRMKGLLIPQSKRS